MSQSILNRYLQPEVLTCLGHQEFEPRSLVLGNLAGAHKSPLSGFAVEFAGHREYVPGDDPKHIDWRVFFKRQKYFIKQYEMETNFVCHLMLDISASMRYGSEGEQKLRWAQQAVATLGYAILRQRDKVSLTTFDEHVVEHVRPSSSMAQIERMSHQLDSAKPVRKTNLAECLHELANRTGRREIILLFSDFLNPITPLESALQQLRYRNHEVVLFHVLHHDELAFELDGMVRFVGLETVGDILTNPADLRQHYLAALKEYRDELEQMAARNRVEYVLVDTSQGLGSVLSDYLHRRSLLNRGR